MSDSPIQPLSLEVMKAKFMAEVNTTHIKYSWDAGWCYAGIDHPLYREVEEMDLSQNDRDEWDDFISGWLSEHEGELFHMSDVVGDRLVNQAESLEGEEAMDYARGLAKYLEKYEPDHNKTKELLEFADRIEATLKLEDILSKE